MKAYLCRQAETINTAMAAVAITMAVCLGVMASLTVAEKIKDGNDADDLYEQAHEMAGFTAEQEAILAKIEWEERE